MLRYHRSIELPFSSSYPRAIMPGSAMRRNAQVVRTLVIRRLFFQTKLSTAAHLPVKLHTDASPPRPHRNSSWLPRNSYDAQRHGDRHFSDYRGSEDDGEISAEMPFVDAASNGLNTHWQAGRSSGGGSADVKVESEPPLDQLTTIMWSKDHANSVHLIGEVPRRLVHCPHGRSVNSLPVSCLDCTARHHI